MDRTSKKILNALIKTGIGADYVCVFDQAWESSGNIGIEDFSNAIGMSAEEVRLAVTFLVSEGFLAYQNANGKSVGFHLSHIGLNWRHFQRKKRIEYIAEKWTDFIAVAISFSSLIVSILALSQTG